jgi:hypothetical protein
MALKLRNDFKEFLKSLNDNNVQSNISYAQKRERV